MPTEVALNMLLFCHSTSFVLMAKTTLKLGEYLNTIMEINDVALKVFQGKVKKKCCEDLVNFLFSYPEQFSICLIFSGNGSTKLNTVLSSNSKPPNKP